jgi:DNA-binding IclR family transcriptional regulator
MPQCGNVLEAMMPTIKSVEKAFDLLFLFDGDRTVLEVKAIARMLGVPLRTTYHLVNTLRDRNVLSVEAGTGQCRLSPQLRRLLAAMDDSADVLRLSRPFLEAPARTGETTQLYLPHGDEVVLVEVVESAHVLRAGPRKGQRIPLHCGAGAKAIFAFQTPEEWDAYIRRNGLQKFGPNTVTDPGRLKRELAGIRRTGFAVSHQEFVPGVRSLGVPLQDATDRVMGSIWLVGPETRLTRTRAREFEPFLRNTATAISTAVWGRSDTAAGRPSAPPARPGVARGAHPMSQVHLARRQS